MIRPLRKKPARVPRMLFAITKRYQAYRGRCARFLSISLLRVRRGERCAMPKSLFVSGFGRLYPLCVMTLCESGFFARNAAYSLSSMP